MFSERFCRCSRFSVINRFASSARRRLRHLRIAIRVVDIEGGELLVVAVRQFDFDVLAHLLHQIVRALVLPFLGVEAERVNDAEKAGAAQDLLRNAVQLMLDVAVDVRDNIFSGTEGCSTRMSVPDR